MQIQVYPAYLFAFRSDLKKNLHVSAENKVFLAIIPKEEPT